MDTARCVDTDLAERFRRREGRAVREVYRRYGRALHATAAALLGDPYLAEEAAQDALVRAWQAAGTVDVTRDLGPWLYAIVRRCAVDVHRRHHRRSRPLPLEAVPDRALAAAAEPVDRLADIWSVRHAVAELPAGQREVVELSYFAGLDHTEIAGRIGVAPGTVKSRLSRAHRRLAGMLDAQPSRR